jgi:hypothetical protein
VFRTLLAWQGQHLERSCLIAGWQILQAVVVHQSSVPIKTLRSGRDGRGYDEVHPACQLVEGELRLDVVDNTRHGLVRVFERTVSEELAGLAGIVVGYDDVIMGLKPKLVQGEQALLG